METVNPPRDFGGALNRAIDLLGARMTHPPAGGGGGRGGRGGRGGGGGGWSRDQSEASRRCTTPPALLLEWP